MAALHRGVIAAVIDGACRDVEEIRKIRFPVICKGVVPNVGSISGYGDVNVSIQCGGVAVSPGDVVVVDGNGVVVVPVRAIKRAIDSDNIMNPAARCYFAGRAVDDEQLSPGDPPQLQNVDWLKRCRVRPRTYSRRRRVDATGCLNSSRYPFRAF